MTKSVERETTATAGAEITEVMEGRIRCGEKATSADTEPVKDGRRQDTIAARAGAASFEPERSH